MVLAKVRKFLTAPINRTSSSAKSGYQIFWFSLSLTFAAIFGILWLQQAFSSEYVVQDDARQHVFWMQRFIDPELFPNDLIADYFQSVAPKGFTSLYRIMAACGINPMLWAKLLPVLLGLLTTVYCFGVCLEIFPVPAAGFIATLLLNQNLWMRDDLASATPRAFVYVLLLAFLYYLLQRKLLFCAVAIALQGLFYPQCVFISTGILLLQIFCWQDGRLRLSRKRNDYVFVATGLAVALLVMLPYALISSKFGPVITAAEAKTLPEFLSRGRSSFFVPGLRTFWLYGSERSTIIPFEWTYLPYNYFPLIFCFGLLLPLLIRYRSRFPLAAYITKKVLIFPQIAFVCLGIFFTAHALLFKLHLPGRYTQYSLRILMALAAGIALIVILDAVFNLTEQQANNRSPEKQFIGIGITVLLGFILVLYPSTLQFRNISFPNASYVIGNSPSLYKFFSQQPKNILIASLAEEVNNLPTFAQRSILVGREYAIPYHLGYSRQIRRRVTELIQAQYSQNLTEVKQFIQNYGISFWLLDRAAFTSEYITLNNWFMQFRPMTTEAAKRLKQGATPALSTLLTRCAVFQDENLIVLQSECILKSK